jgi:hypothetical protein
MYILVGKMLNQHFGRDVVTTPDWIMSKTALPITLSTSFMANSLEEKLNMTPVPHY